MDHSSTINWAGNIMSVGAIVGAIMGWAPTIAAGVALVWYMIQIYESATVQRWLTNRRGRKLARLKAKILLIEAQGEAPLLTSIDADPPT